MIAPTPPPPPLLDSLLSLLLNVSVWYAIACIVPLVLIALDLWAGLAKARQRGELRSSIGYRRTVDKARRYYNMMFAVQMVDVVQMIATFHLEMEGAIDLPQFPIFTYVYLLFIGFVEIKSIYETNEEKERARLQEAGRLLYRVAKSKDAMALATAIGAYLNKSNSNEDDDKGTITEDSHTG